MSCDFKDRINSIQFFLNQMFETRSVGDMGNDMKRNKH